MLYLPLLTFIGHALGSTKAQGCSVDTIIDFDNEPTGVFNVNNLLPAPLPSIPGGPINGALINVMGESKGILFETAGLATKGVVNGILARSPPNFVVLRNGSNMTVSYFNPLLSSFSLSKFFFGCVLPTRNAAVSVAVGCNLTIIGDPADASQAQKVKSFRFDPNGQSVPLPIGVNSEMREAIVTSPDFKNMKRIEFRLEQVAQFPDQGSLLVAALDNLSVSLNLANGICKT